MLKCQTIDGSNLAGKASCRQRRVPQRLLTEAATPEERIERAFRLVVSRRAIEREQKVLLAALAFQPPLT